MKYLKRLCSGGLFLSSFFSFSAGAQENSLMINGFSTVGYSQIIPTEQTSNYSLGVLDDRGTFKRDSIFGLNLIYFFNDQLTFYGQLVSRGSDPFTYDARDYTVGAELFFLSYRPFDWIDLKVGRQIVPLWMVSEQIDIGATYPWIRPPADVYQLAPLKAMTGVGVNISKNIAGIDVLAGFRYGEGDPKSDAWQYIKLKDSLVAFAELSYLGQYKLRSSFGSTRVKGVLKNVPVLELISAGGQSVYLPSTTSSSTLSAYGKGNTADSAYTSDIQFFSVGFNGEWNNFQFLGEYAFDERKQTSVDPLSKPVDTAATNITASAYESKLNVKGYYATIAYRWNGFVPHFTYSHSETNQITTDFRNYDIANQNLTGGPATMWRNIRSGIIGAVMESKYPNQTERTAMVAGINYNFTPNIVGKFEYEHNETGENDHQILIGPVFAKDKRIDVVSTAVSLSF